MNRKNCFLLSENHKKPWYYKIMMANQSGAIQGLIQKLDLLRDLQIYDVRTNLKDYLTDNDVHVDLNHPMAYGEKIVLECLLDLLSVCRDMFEEEIGAIVRFRSQTNFVNNFGQELAYKFTSAKCEMLSQTINHVSKMIKLIPETNESFGEEKVCTQKGSCVNSCVPTRIVGVFII